MNATRRHARQQYIQPYKAKCDAYRFFDLLTSDALLDQVESLLPDHRERLYPPTETLSMFLAQAMSADRSCQNIVNQAAVQRLSYGLSANSTHTGGYCRARQRLPLDLVTTLTRYVGDKVAGHWLMRYTNALPIAVLGATVNKLHYLQNQGKNLEN